MDSKQAPAAQQQADQITALVTVYHRVDPQHLDQALESLWAQTFPAAEVIVVEDGELPEALEAVVVKHEQDHDNLKVVRCPVNRGSGPASQTGLEQVETPWVARLDADDIAVPERFEKQLLALKANPSLSVIGSAMAEFEGDPGNVVRVRALPESHDKIARYAKMNSPVNNPSAMFRADLARRVGGYRNRPYMEDYDLWARMLAAGARFHNLSGPLVLFRADGMFKRRTAKGIFSSERQMQRTLRELGIISWPRALFNLAARTAFRALPTGLMSRAYRRLFVR
nr:glycosyltransferase [Corynebacterium lactis]